MMRMDGATMKREASKAAGMPYRQDPRTISSPEQPGGGFPIRTDSGLGPTGRPAGRVPCSNRGPAGLGAAIRRFRFGERGGATIESAVSLLILVVGFASLMEIVQACYTDDWMSRAARAAAGLFKSPDFRMVERYVGRRRPSGGGSRSFLWAGCRARGADSRCPGGRRTRRLCLVSRTGERLSAGRGAQRAGGFMTASRASCGRAA